MYIYLARPIDQTDPNRRVPGTLFTVNQDILTAIGQQGHSAFQPSRAYQLPAPPWTEADMQHVDAINRFAMLEADGVIAILLPGIATLGTVAEVEQALAADMPVCIVTTESLRQSSIQLASWAARGANIVFCSEEGRIRGLDIKTALTREPVREMHDITGFNSLVPEFVPGRVASPHDLHVKYDAAARPLHKAHSTDAGFDLATTEEAVVSWGLDTLIPTGVIAPPPEGWWGLIKARSSTQRDGIRINEGVIDAGYQGPLFISATLTASGRSNITIPAGTRLAQYILIPTFPGKAVRVTKFNESLRGEKGWGSSGA